MAPKSKSIFRQPGNQHFQLVHRSQRDPLIHDPEASQHVLKAVQRSNDRKGKSRADLESVLSQEAVDERPNVGEASLYGVYYDDTEYDYMQHLKPVGVQEDGVDSVLIEAPTTSKANSKGKGKDSGPVILPPEALPSSVELSQDTVYNAQQSIASELTGLRPDMNPHLRQTLSALEDDAFVDDGLEDDFFGELLADGERDEEEDLEFEFEDEGIEDATVADDSEAPPEDEDTFEARFARFKKEQRTSADPAGDDSDVGGASEGGDTIGDLPKLPVIGGKRRRKGTSDASGYSMSSASLARTDQLLTLDERFERVMATEYASDPDGADEEQENADDSDEAPELITSRSDFPALMDEFLDNYELLGRHLRPAMIPNSSDGNPQGMEKLAALREALGHDERVWGEGGSDTEEEIHAEWDGDGEEKKDRWDCETILTTYSNMENHPRLIRARNPNPRIKIRLDPKTGLPSVELMKDNGKSNLQRATASLDDVETEDGTEHNSVRRTVARARDESKEDKKARKHAVKEERQARRAEKKATKNEFSSEARAQMKGIASKERKMKKL